MNKELKKLIKSRISESEEQAKFWGEKVDNYTKNIIAGPATAELKLARQQCIGKKDKFTAIAEFGNELLDFIKSKD